MKKTPTLPSVLDEIAIYFTESFADPQHDKHQLCLRLSHFKNFILSNFSEYQVNIGIKEFSQGRFFSVKLNPMGTENYRNLLLKTRELLTDAERLAVSVSPADTPFHRLNTSIFSDDSLSQQIHNLRKDSLGQDIASRIHQHFTELLRLLSKGNCTDIKECIRLGVEEFRSARVQSPVGKVRLNAFGNEDYANALFFIQVLHLVTPASCDRYLELNSSDRRVEPIPLK